MAAGSRQKRATASVTVGGIIFEYGQNAHSIFYQHTDRLKREWIVSRRKDEQAWYATTVERGEPGRCHGLSDVEALRDVDVYDTFQILHALLPLIASDKWPID